MGTCEIYLGQLVSCETVNAHLWTPFTHSFKELVASAAFRAVWIVHCIQHPLERESAAPDLKDHAFHCRWNANIILSTADTAIIVGLQFAATDAGGGFLVQVNRRTEPFSWQKKRGSGEVRGWNVSWQKGSERKEPRYMVDVKNALSLNKNVFPAVQPVRGCFRCKRHGRIAPRQMNTGTPQTVGWIECRAKGIHHWERGWTS
jgi:hypothetical protein